MVAKVHSSTLKSAQAKGIEINGGPDDEVYTIVWAEGKKKILHTDAKAGLAEMVRLKMITEDHPKLRAVQSKEDGTWSIRRNTKVLAEGWASLDEAWDAYLESQKPQPKAEGEEGDEESGGEDNGDGSKSIVKKKYREAYRPNEHTNGDEIAAQLKEYLTDKGADGGPRVDRDKMVRFAKANKLWDDRYTDLNNGQVRMNIGNKIRKLARADAEYQPSWVK